MSSTISLTRESEKLAWCLLRRQAHKYPCLLAGRWMTCGTAQLQSPYPPHCSTWSPLLSWYTNLYRDTGTKQECLLDNMAVYRHFGVSKLLDRDVFHPQWPSWSLPWRLRAQQIFRTPPSTSLSQGSRRRGTLVSSCSGPSQINERKKTGKRRAVCGIYMTRRSRWVGNMINSTPDLFIRVIFETQTSNGLGSIYSSALSYIDWLIRRTVILRKICFGASTEFAHMWKIVTLRPAKA